MSAALLADEPIRCLSVKEYHHLAESGAFADERVELLHGVMVRKCRQSPADSTIIVKLNRIFARHLGDEIELRVQLPLQTDEHSEPEPDVAICAPRLDAESAHPTTADLVVEVSDSSRKRDLVTKLPLYAQAGVREYWVVDVQRRVVHVHTQPVGDLYELVRIVHPGEPLEPIAFPDLQIEVAEVLPRA